MEYALEVKDLKKHYPGTEALKGVNLQIKNNSFLALLGKNGAGKSTFIDIISSLTKKTSGMVSVFGHDLIKEETTVKSLIGVVPQELNLPVYDKVIDILINQAGYYGIDAKTAETRAKKYLSILQLTHKQHQPSITLSGGMKRRLMIARAMIHDPQIIFLDEPSAGIDIEIRAIIWQFLKELQKEGKTIVLTTHYLEEAEALCDTIAVLKDGKITINGYMSDILAQVTKTNLAVTVEQSVIKKKDLNLLDANIKKIDNNTLEISIDKNNHSLNKLLEQIMKSGLNITNIRNLKSGLETFL